VVPRAWTLYFAEMVERTLPDDLPIEWIELARAEGADGVPEHLVDPPSTVPEPAGEIDALLGELQGRLG
jgi:hypothetical protein